jgi:hypothetical protein
LYAVSVRRVQKARFAATGSAATSSIADRLWRCAGQTSRAGVTTGRAEVAPSYGAIKIHFLWDKF